MATNIYTKNNYIYMATNKPKSLVKSVATGFGLLINCPTIIYAKFSNEFNDLKNSRSLNSN